jgi:hypothetical protein
MAAGLSDHVWAIEEIVGLLDVVDKKAPLPGKGEGKGEGSSVTSHESVYSNPQPRTGYPLPALSL